MRSFYIDSAKVHIMGENKMKLIRNYLTTEDMTVIIEAVLKEDSALNREIVKVGVIGQRLIDKDELGNWKYQNDIYDKIMSDGINLEKEIVNYSVLEKCIDEELNMNTSVRTFLNEMVKRMPKKFDMNKTINSLKGMVGDAKSNRGNVPDKQ